MTFYEQANSLDRQNLEMNILVMPNKELENKKGICKYLINETIPNNEKIKNEMQNTLNIDKYINIKEEKNHITAQKIMMIIYIIVLILN